MAASHTSIARRCWPALLLAPLLALGLQSLAYALVTPACASQGGEGLHLLAGGSLLLALVLTALAGQSWRQAFKLRWQSPEATADREGGRDLFLGRVATLVGVFSSLTIAALWIPLWLLPPCS
jgi:small-conductance mechanosensitive channel